MSSAEGGIPFTGTKITENKRTLVNLNPENKIKDQIR